MAYILLDLMLKAVEYGVAQRARRDHRPCTIGLGRLDVLPGELDCDALVVRRGVEAAAFGASAVVDRTASEDDGEPFQGDVVTRVDKLVARWRPCDVATVKGGDREAGQRAPHQGAQPRLADVFVQDPQEMADARAPA